MNKVILIGNLTRDPESGTSPSGVSYCKFTIAVNRGYKNEVDYFNVVTWRYIAESCEKRLFKGNKVGIVGVIHMREYETKNNVKRYVAEIIADEVEFLSLKKNNAQNGSDGLKTENDVRKLEEVDASDDNLPF